MNLIEIGAIAYPWQSRARQTACLTATQGSRRTTVIIEKVQKY